ncbi:acyl-CoA dehydrogenase family protein [Thalassovita sp.]|uniref:acyl-CoA dehydrogenase family protein n=1 Tax=Thalassovita sp. TaxID=1979401 RepID=UPI0029DE5AE3|nr:acyl-CoA dehydrogenase family protein [Thalassovita sp.]
MRQMFDTHAPDQYFSEDHLAFRRAMRSFVDQEIRPNIDEWERAERLPRALYRQAAGVGFLGLLYPEAYGGSEADIFMQIVATEELGLTGAGGVGASLGSHSIAIPPIAAIGSKTLKQRVLPPVIAGEKIAALAITEPSGGSDVAALKTTARRDGDSYVINGEKAFITSGMQADFLTVACRTDPANPGPGGLSFILVEGDTPGLTRTALHKMGWHASDTALLHFDNVRVPADNLVGAEGEGFKAAMLNFNNERLTLAVIAYAAAQACLDEATDWARTRRTFGKPLIEQQVIRHKLVDMAMRIQSARALVLDVAWRHLHRMDPLNIHVARTGMAKITATDTVQFVASEAVQIMGAMGYMRGSTCERVFRETKVLSIGGGTDEVIRNLVASQMGI